MLASSRMFLVSDTPEAQARDIRGWLPVHPSVALVVSATYFEWTLCRVLISLSSRPNTAVRRDLSRVFGLDRYKQFWSSELGHLTVPRRLTEVIKDWNSVTKAFDARNRLVHGRDRYTKKMALPHVENLLRAVVDLRVYALENGYDVAQRLLVRREAVIRPK